ncbi:hypothetical protein Ait01nite_036290 [Actinoplanes italicus]|uniref:Uncharacterized protein n=1 Tax=Actinoplanes italicus TaxID=113567 RepID=A0A2T0K8M4_9ACTN|nr:hypothetical protein [Actinoplanes italicus]PRX19401.1 hypothetical protein CLV67_110153 [Actinoplanes italicus]GIE30584.1 hypothetical protein Ait01nite_036290 [Actinoplanes italicus]
MRDQATRPKSRTVAQLNGRYHRPALRMFMFVVIAHWAEHLVQAYQIWVMGMPRPQARGVLGQFFPWLITSEWLHYGFAIVMLIGLFLLLPGFTGKARMWWVLALGLQFWHHIEHLLLLIQAQAGANLFGAAAPTSIAQLIMPRVELHLFYNSVVFIPMVVAMYLHLRPLPAGETAACDCADRRDLVTAGASTPTPA